MNERTFVRFPSLIGLLTAALLSSVLAGGQQAAKKFFPVKPIQSARPATQAGAELHLARGQFFSYALPQGWRVGEEGQFALSLVAADNKAITVMVGNAGMQPNYPPGQFVYEKLMAMRPQIGQGVGAQPVAGFPAAYQFEVAYYSNGVPWHGVAKCSVAGAYDSATMVMTAAITEASQWGSYSSWLPAVADQISATNGAAFGRRGVMAQNLQNSTAYAEAARQYRDWSQKNWQGVTDARNASQDRQNFAVRENLGGVQTFTNPYDSRVPLELPQTYNYFWVDRQGNVVGSNDATANPNVGSTGDWRQMPRYQPQ